jgi:hypothetical protein
VLLVVAPLLIEEWVRGGWPGLGPALGVAVGLTLVYVLIAAAGLTLWQEFGGELDR